MLCLEKREGACRQCRRIWGPSFTSHGNKKSERGGREELSQGSVCLRGSPALNPLTSIGYHTLRSAPLHWAAARPPAHTTNPSLLAWNSLPSPGRFAIGSNSSKLCKAHEKPRTLCFTTTATVATAAAALFLSRLKHKLFFFHCAVESFFFFL